jgi:hypothetical protein
LKHFAAKLVGNGAAVKAKSVAFPRQFVHTNELVVRVVNTLWSVAGLRLKIPVTRLRSATGITA